MSHGHQTSYGYPVNVDYYIDENDGFVGDYSDNDAFSDNQLYQQQMKPITSFSTKVPQLPMQQQHINNRVHQHSVPYIQPNYQDQLSLQRFDVHQQYCPLSQDPQPATNYQTTTVYGAAPQNTPVHRFSQPMHIQEPADLNYRPPQRANIKRHPLTVGTPKYYRKSSGSNSLYNKRPSALCLPVASQPDPAVYRKPKKYANYETVLQTQDIQRHNKTRTAIEEMHPPDILPHKVHSEGDVNMSGLDEMLNKVEAGEVPKISSKGDLAKISKYLRPKVPASIRAKQEKQKLKSLKLGDLLSHNFGSPAKTGHEKKMSGMEIREVTADSLEKLLNQLKKCELTMGQATNDAAEMRSDCGSAKQSRRNADAEKIVITDDESKKQAASAKPDRKSFNYQDIVDHREVKAYSDSTSSIQDITRKLLSSASTSVTSSQQPRSNPPKPTVLDDTCALELHRSKSYIVNLIDRALSKELGTVPGERTRKEFDNMSPKRAIDMVNRHAKPSQDISLEITSALTDSIISNATAPDAINSQRSSTNSSKVCCCAEEPTYIKQLKQLRWGHLKHIQREVKRLEDLERFLDSCSITTIPED